VGSVQKISDNEGETFAAIANGDDGDADIQMFDDEELVRTTASAAITM
jgi:hypothetical protein